MVRCMVYYHTEDEWEQTMEVIFFDDKKSPHIALLEVLRIGMSYIESVRIFWAVPNFCFGQIFHIRSSSTLASTRGQYFHGTIGKFQKSLLEKSIVNSSLNTHVVTVVYS